MNENLELREWLAVNLMGWAKRNTASQHGPMFERAMSYPTPLTHLPAYESTYDGMGAVIEALHARKDTTYLIDMSAEYGNGGKLVWRVNVCTPRNSYCWRDAYGPLWESLPLGVAESVKKAIELEQESA